MEKGELRRKGKGLLRSRGPEEKGLFIGADFGITSGLTGSSIEDERGEGVLCSECELVFSPGLGELGGLSSLWFSSSSFLLLVDKSSGWFLLSCSLSFSGNKDV